ncbi:glycosyltransferase family 4 protein [Allosphingosinicella indica]|uniref:glycosyltransferase family 4 protein n=1 Tax=Allosphingosinicella indica TaxID=941907 RepID=UPI001FCDBAAC|nr:glycosyltransferase family 4 protein [Allosphingosinicella indica]
MANKRIVLAINASWNIINFRLGLVRGLQAAGYEVIALAPPDRFSPALADHGITFIPIDLDPRGTSVTADLDLLRRYRKVLREVRPAAFLAYTIKPNIYGSIAARMLDIPVINNIAGLGDTFIGNTWLNRLVRGLYRLALSRSPVIFFQNPDDRALFLSRKIVRDAQTRLLPGSGVDLDRFSPPAATGRQDGAVTFLMVARLLRSKGVADFVEAGRMVRTKHPHTQFQLLGLVQDGKDAIPRAEIDHWVNEGAITFLGGADDVRPFIAAADCIVLPTYYPEGTPRSLLEAAAMGRPLIASDMPGCREIVEDGRNGFRFPARDVCALAERMTTIAEMSSVERAAMGAKSRRKVETQFDERIVIERYREALDIALTR